MATPNYRDHRHGRSASLTINPDSNSAATAILSATNSRHHRFEGPRSPPNTAHVPCKFFRQGACQAGNACPFSHELGAGADTICKYFAKGNCKFGPKCANIHVLPNGKRINYTRNGIILGAAPITLTGQPHATPTSVARSPTTASALTNGLYATDAIRSSISGPTPVPNPGPYPPSYPYSLDDRQPHRHLGRQPSLEIGLPTDPFQFSDSNYGSPRDEDSSSRLGLALSPANPGGLSVLDAPLPASFDSNGISNPARFPAAPWPASMPSQYGLASVSHSFNNTVETRPSEAVKLLHSSAFGGRENIAPTPPAPSTSPPPQGGMSEEYFGKRLLHSSRFVKQRVMSSSVPKTLDQDWEFSDDSFEDFVPHDLRELLTPIEMARRRNSSRAIDVEKPAESLKLGGGPTVSSPNPWGPLYQRQNEQELELSRSNKYSPFGHVGSPLRNSSLAHEMLDGDLVAVTAERPSASSRSKSDSLSVLTQQIQRARISEHNAGLGSPHLRPGSAASRILPVGPVGSIGSIGSIKSISRTREAGIERHLSNGSANSLATSRSKRPIDEEDLCAVFSMEEDEQQNHEMPKLPIPSRTSSQTSSSIWSYAGEKDAVAERSAIYIGVNKKPILRIGSIQVPERR